MSDSARKVIAVVCGVILVLGVVTCLVVQDPSTIVLVAIFAVLYSVYLTNLRKRLNQSKKQKKPADSPLMRRR